MQPADDVQLGNAKVQGLARFLNNFIDAELEAVGVAFLAGKGAEFAAQDAVGGLVNVAVDDVAGSVAHFAPASQVGDGTQGVQVLALEKAQRVGVGQASAGGDLLIKVAQVAALDEKIHRIGLAEAPGLANTGDIG
jgi:hypothetical protein